MFARFGGSMIQLRILCYSLYVEDMETKQCNPYLHSHLDTAMQDNVCMLTEMVNKIWVFFAIVWGCLIQALHCVLMGLCFRWLRTGWFQYSHSASGLYTAPDTTLQNGTFSHEHISMVFLALPSHPSDTASLPGSPVPFWHAAEDCITKVPKVLMMLRCVYDIMKLLGTA